VSRRRVAEPEERRQALLAAARDVFVRRGYHAATVDDITRAAGVAKGTFYLYFSEKREVFYALVRGFFQLILDIGRSVSKDPTGPADFVLRAERAAHELMRVFVENREMARLAHRESMGLDAELEKMVASFYRDVAALEADNIRHGIALGVFREVDPLVTAYAHIGMVERVLLAMLEENSPLPPPETIVREVLALAFSGLTRA